MNSAQRGGATRPTGTEEDEHGRKTSVGAVVASLSQLSIAATQRYADLYTASTIRAFPEHVRDHILRALDKSDQIEKLGEYKAWHPNGQLWCHEQYAADGQQRLGLWWHPNGNQWREESYDEQGRKHGLARWWHPNGQLRVEVRYEAGREVEGTYRAWTQSGNLITW